MHFITNSFALLCQPHSSQVPARASGIARESLNTRVISTIGLLAGLTAILAGCSSNQVSESPTPIPVSSVSAEEVKNYAKAVLAIELERQEAYNDIQQMTNDEQVPDITCTKADTIAVLPKSVQDLAVEYCNNAKKIGEGQGLTMDKFNAITVSAQSNPELGKRIQNELVRLQR